MKKIIIAGLILSIAKCDVVIDQDMIYGSLINAIKNVPDSIANMGNYIYRTEIKKEKSYWWYFKKNTKLKTKLKEKHIDYYTLLKQGLYPRKPYDNSREAEIIRYSILTALAKENNIKVDSIQKTEKKVKKRKKLNIEIKDIRDIKKN